MNVFRRLQLLGIALALPYAACAADQLVIPLWPSGAPGSEARKAEPEKVAANGAVSNIHHPTLTVYLPAKDKATGAAVIVAPGGGHRFHSIAHEGYSVGQWLADNGVAGFVLKYRLARDDANAAPNPQPYTIKEHALADGQRALRLIRSRAKEWGLNSNAIGMLGFSAGGEVVALAAMAAAPGDPAATDPIERESARPDFQALIYPGRSGDIVPAKGAPPAFLLAGARDRADISEGLPKVYLLFKAAEVPVDLHMYASAGHGFGLRATNKTPVGSWPLRFREFLVDQKFIPAPAQ